ncbi:hypothetical protein [Enterocloster citroniae]|uniref:hypothetical protein n=1 Tax=Enterocloster citroniae TaxID=358743 RepID=UPI00349EE57E
MVYPIDEDKFVSICMREIGEHDEVDEKVAHAVAATLNWAHHKGMIDNEKRM